MTKAVAYLRTSSMTNVGFDKDSDVRQRAAVESYASANGIEIAHEFYDAAVSGADAVDIRPGFTALMEYCNKSGVKMILIESASRFARDLMVQLTGHALLQRQGIDIVPVDAPQHFTDPSPTAVMIQQILGSISQFERAGLVMRLKAARDRKREKTGRCEGRPPAPQVAQELARRVKRENPQASLRQIAAVLEADGHKTPYGNRYSPSSIAIMLKGNNVSVQ